MAWGNPAGCPLVLNLRPLHLAWLLLISAAAQASVLSLNPQHIAERQQLAPDDFAENLPLALDAQQAGEWRLQGETLIWVDQITVDGALALALEMETLRLPEGASLAVGAERWQGPLQRAHLFTRHQAGDQLQLRAELPRAAASAFVLRIAAVQAAYRDPLAIMPPPHAKAGDPCQLNAACEADAQIQRWGSGVVALQVLNTTTCTGTLMNNSAEDGRLYLLTARHCYANTSGADPVRAAASLRVAWNAVTPCGNALSSAWRGDSLVTSGAQHRAEYGDAWLVELDSAPPESLKPWYAGFDVSDQPPMGGVVGLHHGGALQRQLLASPKQPEAMRLVQQLPSIDLLAWRVVPQLGAALPGASGSPLFDQSGHLLGTLSAGSSCSALAPQVMYARLSQAWHGDGTAKGSLQAWLDPRGRGASLPGKSFAKGEDQGGVASGPASIPSSAAPEGYGGVFHLHGGVILLLLLWRRHRRKVI